MASSVADQIRRMDEIQREVHRAAEEQMMLQGGRTVRQLVKETLERTRRRRRFPPLEEEDA